MNICLIIYDLWKHNHPPPLPPQLHILHIVCKLCKLFYFFYLLSLPFSCIGMFVWLWSWLVVDFFSLYFATREKEYFCNRIYHYTIAYQFDLNGFFYISNFLEMFVYNSLMWWVDQGVYLFFCLGLFFYPNKGLELINPIMWLQIIIFAGIQLQHFWPP